MTTTTTTTTTETAATMKTAATAQEHTMKAIVQETYGAPEDVLELRTIARPEIGDDEVLVRIHASAVAGDDWHLMRGLPYAARPVLGFRKPKTRPGREVAGVVEAVGAKVTEFSAGDEVFGWAAGAFAEYAAVPESRLAQKPANLTFEEAAVVPISAFTALQAVRDAGGLQPGQRILIIGASGGVGSFAVQIAKALGGEVTGLASTRSLDAVRALGADHVIDYTAEDFADGTRRFDVIVDLVGNRSLKDLRRALTPKGTLVMVGGTGGRWFKGTDRFLKASLLSLFVGQTLTPLIHKDDKNDLVFLKGLIEAGEVTPALTATYPLAEVADAIRHFEAGHARGKVAVTI